MNKFATFAVLALAALAVSVSSAPTAVDEEMTQAAFVTSNEDETAELKTEKLKVFEDFCINTRDYVLRDIKTQANQMTSGVFSLLFNSATEIAKEGLEVQELAAQRLSAQLANPEAAIEGGDNEIDQIIARGQTQMQDQSQPKSALTAFRTAVSAISSRVGGLVNQRINYLSSLANPATVFNVLNKGCNQIATYETELRNQLETYKQQLSEEYKSFSLDDVPCATALKITRSEGVCSLFRVAVAPMKKIIGA